MKQIYDVIVVGVGGMGSTTCYHLAKRGLKVLGLEQFDIPHGYGSSHGQTRIIRLAYFEHPSYVPLLRRGYQLWEEIEQVSGENLLYKVGSLDIGASDSEVFANSLSSCKLHNIPYQILTGSEVNKRFPGYNVPNEYNALYQEDGGFLVPERAITAFVHSAHRHGAEIRAREKVVQWKSTKGIIQVKSDRGNYEAKELVITAGAWSSGLLPALSGLAVPERQVLAWFQPQEPALFQPDVFPVFVMQVKEDLYYGFPTYGIPGFKFGKFRHLKEVVEPDDYNREPNAKDEEVLRAFSAQMFPKGNGPVMSLKTCMFTNSPDGHFILDVHPEYSNVSLAAGFSGHGYKFASVIGEIMADLATEKTTRHPIDFLGLERLL